MEKEVVKGLVDLVKVFKTYGLLIFLFTFSYPLHEYLCPGLEKYYKVRRGEPFLQELKQLLIQPELLFIQVDPCKYPVLVEKIVRNDGALEKAFLAELQGMLISSQKEEYLYLKAVSLGVLVKLFKKRVVLGVLQQDLPVDPLGELDGKACLAHSQGAFNYNMVLWNAYFNPPLWLK